MIARPGFAWGQRERLIQVLLDNLFEGAVNR